MYPNPMRDLVSKNNSRLTSGLYKAYMCTCEHTTRTHAQRHGIHIHKAVKTIFVNTKLAALEPGCFILLLTLYDTDLTQLHALLNHSIALVSLPVSLTISCLFEPASHIFIWFSDLFLHALPSLLELSVAELSLTVNKPYYFCSFILKYIIHRKDNFVRHTSIGIHEALG